jgi:hypothetical protein
MEERKPITHITAGLLIAGLLIVFAIITNFLGFTQQKSLGYLLYIITIGLVMFFVRQYGNANNNTKSFGDLFAFGFKTTALFTSIYIIFLVLFFLIFPDMKEKSLEMARHQMEQSSNVTDDQIDKGMEIAKNFFWVMLVAGTLFVFIIVGAIGSLLGAAITKKQPHNPFDQPAV